MLLGKKTYIIAEAGINHNGNFKNAKKLIKEAKNCGVNAIKFQSFKSEKVVTKNLILAKYQRKQVRNLSKMIDMIKKYELTEREQKNLQSYAKKLNLDFISSAFDLESLSFLINNLRLKILKIPSGEITNLPYLIKVAKSKKKIILSTGMCNIKEIESAINILIKNGLRKKNITILHCNSSYPTPFRDVNLRVIPKLNQKFKVDIGYSDHTQGTDASIGAVVFGAKVIEKHFTLNKNWEGPDQKASLNPKELRKLVISIRNIEESLGDEKKFKTKSEKINIFYSRKSIVANKKIKKGEKFTETNITVKRPGNGISPMKWFKVLKKKSRFNFSKDQLIKL